MKRNAIVAVVMFVVGTLVMLAAFKVYAAPAQVCLKDANGTKCLNVQGGSVNAGKVNALLWQAGKLRKQIQDMLDAGNGKAGDLTGDLVDLKKKVKDLQDQIMHLDGIAKSGQEDAKKALKELDKAKKCLNDLLTGLEAHDSAIGILAKRTRDLKNRRINIELGVFGGSAYSYGGFGGGLVSLALPMGEDGLWTTRLTGGFGLSPSIGLGWLGMGTLTRTLANGRLEAGPAMLAMGDAGDLLSGNKNWLMGGGAELRLNITKVIHLSVIPFVGVAVRSETSGVGWAEAVYKDSACGPILVKEAGWTRYEESRKLKLATGAFISLTFSLF